MTSNIHYLKTEERFFNAIVSGDKTFELRAEDESRYFKIGDILVLREINLCGFPSGREVVAKVNYVLTSAKTDEEEGRVALTHLQDLLKPNVVIIGFYVLSMSFNYLSKGKEA